MNRKEIFEKLQIFAFSKEDFIIILDASMVCQKIKRKALNIVIAVSKDLFEYLKPKSKKLTITCDIELYKYQDIEITNNFYNIEGSVQIEGFNFQNAQEILQLKKAFINETTKSDIKQIELFLAQKDNRQYEKALYNQKINLIAGVDEVGRGPLVGPVVAAAVILPENFILEGLTDSKKLSEKKRNLFNDIIRKKAISYGIGIVKNDIIDKVNIYEATKLAMYEAINNLKIKPEHVLVDAMKLVLEMPTTSIIKGDLKSISIAAASVIAKVERDKLMIELDKKFPYYNFKKNKGYPTKEHIKAIEKHGIIELHRKTYGPVKEYLFSHK